MEINKTNSKILKWATILGIIIVLNLFFNYAITLFYETPQWNSFCAEKQVVEKVGTQKICVENGGQWFESNTSKFDIREPKIVGGLESENGYCNINFKCQNKFDEVRDNYNRDVFIILTILGVASIVGGILVGSVSGVVATGLSYGGVLSLIIASMRYWSSAGNLLKFAILAVALIVLIWFALKKFEE